jgi:hypothetical protein
MPFDFGGLVFDLGRRYELHTYDLSPDHQSRNYLAPWSMLPSSLPRAPPRLPLDLQSISDLSDLEVLILENFHETLLPPLKTLQGLRVLHVFRSGALVDLTSLEALKKLQVLSVTGTRVADLEPLTALTNLRVLFLAQQEKALDLRPLRKLKLSAIFVDKSLENRLPSNLKSKVKRASESALQQLIARDV